MTKLTRIMQRLASERDRGHLVRVPTVSGEPILVNPLYVATIEGAPAGCIVTVIERGPVNATWGLNRCRRELGV